jgi:hypothetical protein
LKIDNRKSTLVVSFTWTIRIPSGFAALGLRLLLLYRRLRYGYPFRRIPLTRGKYAIVDPDDYHSLAAHKWQLHQNRTVSYAVRTVRRPGQPNKLMPMHRQVMNAPPGMLVDHINHDGLDNRKANLRLATPSQNSRNQRKCKPTASRYKGLSWDRDGKKWRVRIRANGRYIPLGRFNDEIQAARAYDEAAKKYHGEFASLNFLHKNLKSQIVNRKSTW